MKTAIIVNGFLRTWELAHSSFTNTFSHMSPDIFITTYDKQYSYHPAVAGSFNIIGDNHLTDDDVIRMCSVVSPKMIVLDNFDDYEQDVEDDIENIHPGMKTISGCYGQIRKLKNMADILKRYEEQNNFQYDVIIKTRTDLIYNDNLNLDLEPKQVIVDSSNIFPNDCIFALHRDDFYSVVNFLYDEFYKYTIATSIDDPPHELFYNAFVNSNLNFVPRNIINHVLRSTGKHFYTKLKGKHDHNFT